MADSKEEGVLSDLEGMVQCPLCFEAHDDPRSLPCQHWACLPCLVKLVQNSPNRSKVRCPSCRVQVKVPSTGAAFLIRSLNDTVLKQQQHSEENVTSKCTVHKKELFCQTCFEQLCARCVLKHMLSIDEARELNQEVKLEAQKLLLQDRIKNLQKELNNIRAHKGDCEIRTKRKELLLHGHLHQVMQKLMHMADEIQSEVQTSATKEIKRWEDAEATFNGEMDQLMKSSNTVQEAVNTNSYCIIKVESYKKHHKDICFRVVLNKSYYLDNINVMLPIF